MKNWKCKYMTLFLVAALGGAIMAFTACDGTGSEQSGLGDSMETSSSLTESSLDESASEEAEQSAASSEEIEQSKENVESVEGELSSKEEKGGEKEPDGGNEEKPTVLTEEEWEQALTATNYTALGETWNANSTSSVLNVKREDSSYYMGTTSEEYIVEVGETNVYYRWSSSDKAWKEDDSAPSQQHLIPEQMRSVLHGAYDLFTYSEESGMYEASNVKLTLMGKESTFDFVTVAFEKGNLAVLYCEADASGMCFTYSQYGATRVEFIEKSEDEEGPSINDSDDKINSGMGDHIEKPDDDNQADNQNERMSLSEWTKMLNMTNYEANVRSNLGEGYTLSRDGNLYYYESKSALGRIQYYFEVGEADTYIYVFDEQTRAWTKEIYDEEWKDEFGLYYGLDIFLKVLIDNYNAFDFYGDRAEAKGITISGYDVQDEIIENVCLQIMNDTVSSIEVRVPDTEELMRVVFYGTTTITLPQA